MRSQNGGSFRFGLMSPDCAANIFVHSRARLHCAVQYDLLQLDIRARSDEEVRSMARGSLLYTCYQPGILALMAQAIHVPAFVQEQPVYLALSLL
jgi:hypothetical protein